MSNCITCTVNTLSFLILNLRSPYVHNFIIGMTEVGITSGRIQVFFCCNSSNITNQSLGKWRKSTINFSTKGSWVWLQLVTVFNTVLHLFLNFTTQREAAIWVKSIQKMLYVVQPTCTLYQLLQNIWHSERKNTFFPIQSWFLTCFKGINQINAKNPHAHVINPFWE